MAKKSAASAAIPNPIVPASVSSWTRAAYEDLDAADEPAEMEDDEEPLIEEEEEDPSGWFVAPSASGRPFFWHRSSRRSVWKLPPGASARKKKERRKRKKWRKRRTPRSPRPLLRARARRRQRQWQVSGLRQAQDARHHGRFGPEGFLQVCLRILRCAWFDSGYMRCVSLRSISSSTCIGGLWILRSILDLLFFSVCLVQQWIQVYASVYVAGLPGHDASRAVFLRCPQAPDARHHGRYGQEGQSTTGALVPQLQFFTVVNTLVFAQC